MSGVEPGVIAVTVVAEWLLARLLDGASSRIARTPVERAIAATQDQYQDVVVDDALRAWCDSRDFQDLLRRFVAGERDLSDADVVAAFLSAGGLYVPDPAQRRDVGSRVVASFFRELEKQMYSEPAGLVAAAARNEVLHQATHEQLESIAGGLERLPDILSTRVADAVAGDTARSRNSDMHSRVDAARDLLLAGKLTAARSILDAVRTEMATRPDSDVAFRIETNLGAVALGLGDLPLAKTLFDLALALRPDHPTALANSAHVELLTGNDTVAAALANRAWKREQTESTAVALMTVLHATNQVEELRQLVVANDWIRANASCLAVLGQIALESGDAEAAVNYLRTSRRIDPSQELVLIHLAVALVRQTQNVLDGQAPLPWRMDPVTLADLEEADQLLTEVETRLADREPRVQRLEAIALRGSVRAMLQRKSAALADADFVLYEDPKNVTALRTKGLALLADRPAEAAGLLDLVWSTSQDDPMVAVALARARRDSGEPAVARDLLESLRAVPLRSDVEILALASLAETYGLLNEIERATEIEAEITARWPDEPQALAALAAVRGARGDNEGAVALMAKVVTITAPGPLQEHVRIDLGDALIALGRYRDAATALEPIAVDDAPLSLRQRYAFALYRGGRLRDALSFSRRQRERHGALRIISEIEAEILARTGDIDGALAAMEALAETESTAPLWLDAAVMAAQARDLERARIYASRVDADRLTGDPTRLMQLAQVLHAIGDASALGIAYEARRAAYGDSTMHLAYAGLFLAREDNLGLGVNDGVVATDTVVVIERSGESRTITIETDDPDAAKGEITPENPLAQRLLGRHRGETVVLRERGPEDLRYVVRDVKSKYVHAFQDSLTNFSTLFPDDSSLYRIEIKDDDISAVLGLLERKQAVATQVLALYAKGRLPLASVARMLNAPLVDVTRDLLQSSEHAILASTGDAETETRACQNATSADIAVDLISIVTANDIGLLDHLADAYKRVVVPRQAVDELARRRTELTSSKVSGVMAKIGDRYTIRDVTAEDIEVEVRRLDELLAKIQQGCEIVAVPGLMDVLDDERDMHYRTLGEATFAAVQLSRDEKLHLWVDDAALRALVQAEWHVETTWTQPVLLHALNQGAITRDLYLEMVARLAESRCLHALLTPEDIVSVIAQEGGTPTKRAIRVVAYALGPDFNESHASQLAAEVIKGMWALPLLTASKQLLLDLILSSLVRGRRVDRVVGALLQRLNVLVKFFVDRDALLSTVGLWARAQSHS